MGLIFDKHIARHYESWCRSPHGRAIENSIEQLMLLLLDLKPGERALDIGCGTGSHLLILSKLGLNVSGIDASPYMIQKARERFGQRCELKTGMAEALPFDDNEFDLVVIINTLEFLDDALQALREAGRVANRKVFIGVINSLSCNGLSKKAQGLLGDPLFSHAKFYNIWQLKSLLQKAYGHVPVSWSCIEKPPFFIGKTGPPEKSFLSWKHFPFGSFLGISATMVPKVRTNNLPLKIRLKKTRSPLIEVGTAENQNSLKSGRGKINSRNLR